MNFALLLLPDFALIIAGFILRRVLGLGDHFWAGLEKLLYFVLFPALLFVSIARTKINFVAAMPLIVAALVITFSGIALSYAGRFLFRASAKEFASGFQTAFRFNSYIAFAIAGKLHGESGIALMGIVVAVAVPVVNIAAVSMLAKHAATNAWRELLVNPLILSTAAGILFSAMGLTLPDIVETSLMHVGSVSVVLGLLAVGAALKLSGQVTSKMMFAWWCAVKLVALPLVAWGIGRWLGLTGAYWNIALAYSALPTASSAYILAVRMNGDGQIVALLISAMILIAMVSMPFWLSLLST